MGRAAHGWAELRIGGQSKEPAIYPGRWAHCASRCVVFEDLGELVCASGGGSSRSESCRRCGFAAGVLPVEFLLHAWDMAQGAGKPLVVGDEVVAYVHKLAEQVVPGARGSSFADEVTPSPTADPMERLAAYSGRRPSGA